MPRCRFPAIARSQDPFATCLGPILKGRGWIHWSTWRKKIQKANWRDYSDHSQQRGEQGKYLLWSCVLRQHWKLERTLLGDKRTEISGVGWWEALALWVSPLKQKNSWGYWMLKRWALGTQVPRLGTNLKAHVCHRKVAELSNLSDSVDWSNSMSVVARVSQILGCPSQTLPCISSRGLSPKA